MKGVSTKSEAHAHVQSNYHHNSHHYHNMISTEEPEPQRGSVSCDC